MGMMTPRPPIFGNTCPACDPELWATGETPLYVKAVLAGLVVCPAAPNPAPNGIWVLKQHEHLPCKWILTTDEYSLAWEVSGAGSAFDVVCAVQPWKFYFNGSSPANCDVTFPNVALDCSGANTYAHSGNVEIGWP